MNTNYQALLQDVKNVNYQTLVKDAKQKFFSLKKALFKEPWQVERFNFLEILIEVSFRTKFEVWYSDEFNNMQKITVEDFKYSKLIYISEVFKHIEIRVFVQNPSYFQDEILYIKLLQKDKILSTKKFTISNFLYDGWFIFEKEV